MLPEVPKACEQFANAAAKELCVTHAGAVVLNQSNAGLIPLSIIPAFATAYWAQLMAIRVFETGTQTPVLNGEVVDIQLPVGPKTFEILESCDAVIVSDYGKGVVVIVEHRRLEDVADQLG